MPSVFLYFSVYFEGRLYLSFVLRLIISEVILTQVHLYYILDYMVLGIKHCIKCICFYPQIQFPKNFFFFFWNTKQWIMSRKPVIFCYFSFSSQDLFLSSVRFASFVVKSRVIAGTWNLLIHLDGFTRIFWPKT